MMRCLPTIHGHDPGVIFFSSPSIEQAEEKIETFDRLNDNDKFVPYLYTYSLTALYERFCPPSDRIGHVDILEEGGVFPGCTRSMNGSRRSTRRCSPTDLGCLTCGAKASLLSFSAPTKQCANMPAMA